MKVDLEKLLELEAVAQPAPWAWRKFGNEEVLVCDERDRKIVISGGYTRNERGVLEPMKPEQPISDLIPAMRNNIAAICKELIAARKVIVALNFQRDLDVRVELALKRYEEVIKDA